jgi:hypothetical protein
MTDVDPPPRARILLVRDGHDVPFGAIDAGTPCDLALVDELCRLRQAAIRQGLVVRLADADDELRDWLTFVGVATLAGLDFAPGPGEVRAQASMRSGRPNSGKRCG